MPKIVVTDDFLAEHGVGDDAGRRREAILPDQRSKPRANKLVTLKKPMVALPVIA
jgi:hypothetical protein